ncbi:MAG: HAD superfamily hydrolase (TIGR01459 family) [Parasphingorhabdus sp.]|jgi:HAD superfamily hydrolase (TIGR01459 family)
MTQIVKGVKGLVKEYQLLLIDIWGVLYDGGQVFSPALHCLQKLSALHVPIILLSNAARRKSLLEAQLSHAGIPTHLYSSLLSSGELTWQFLYEQTVSRMRWRNGYYLGSPRSRTLCNGLGCTWQDSLADADFVLTTGVPEGIPLRVEPLNPLICQMVELDLPMVCANPDLVAVRSGVLGISAGSIAQTYLEQGGNELISFGKPDVKVFQQAMAEAGVSDPKKVLMIGDAMATDVVGANHAGIDSLLIASGIHRDILNPVNNESIDKLVSEYQVSPTFVSGPLAW